MLPIVLALLAYSVAAAPTPQTCKDQIIAVNKEWTLPLTPIAYRQFCTYTFKLPQNTFANVDLQAQNTNGSSIYINDDYNNNIWAVGKGANTVSVNYAIPGNVQINIQTQDTKEFQIQVKITVQTATPLANVVGKISTDLNAPSSLLYFDQWEEGASYNVNSLKSDVNLKVALSDYSYSDDLENIFIYDGGVVVGTLKTVSDKQNFISKTNQVTLYMAKKPRCKGALLVTDNSNVSPFYSHFVTYVPISGYTSHLIMGDTNQPGAVTIIGNSDGSTPVTILQLTRLDDDTGKFTVGTGGPIADYTKTTAIGDNDLPKKLTGNVNTIYVSQENGIVKFTV